MEYQEIPDEMKNAFLDIYMDFHVSELTKIPDSVRRAWYIGQMLYTEKLRRKNIKHG